MVGKKYYSHDPIDLDRLVNDIKKIGMTVSVVTTDMENTFVIVLEQYFYRVDSAASCSVVINNMSNGALIVIIASGGGTGLLNISLGANQKLYNNVEKCLLNQCKLECQLQLNGVGNFNEY